MFYYYELVNHYENCFDQYGATHKGVDWPNEQDLELRFSVMLDLCKPRVNQRPFRLLDLGCGYGAFFDFLKKNNLTSQIAYKGIDLSLKMIEAARLRHDASLFEVRDILINKLPPNSFDYIIMNGLFTEKRGLTHEQMEAFLIDMLKTSFDSCSIGMAFNVMNSHVDWFRDDLFYVSFDQMSAILKKYATRNILMRADYGLYEYTVYVYKNSNVTQYTRK